MTRNPSQYLFLPKNGLIKKDTVLNIVANDIEAGEVLFQGCSSMDILYLKKDDQCRWHLQFPNKEERDAAMADLQEQMQDARHLDKKPESTYFLHTPGGEVVRKSQVTGMYALPRPFETDTAGNVLPKWTVYIRVAEGHSVNTSFEDEKEAKAFLADLWNQMKNPNG